MLSHGEFDISILHLEDDSGCIQVTIQAAVVCYRDHSPEIHFLYVLMLQTYSQKVFWGIIPIVRFIY